MWPGQGQPILLLIGIGAITGCADHDPVVGRATWDSRPDLNEAVGEVAWAERSGPDIVVRTYGFDREAHCSDVVGLDSTGLVFTFNRPGALTLGAVPIVSFISDPAEAQASGSFAGYQFASGELTNVEVGDRIRSTFTARTTHDFDVTGYFDAPICY